MINDDLRRQAQSLLSQAGGGDIKAIDRVFGGRNNQVFKVSDSSGTLFALKVYFRHPQDPRDRLGAEWGFCQYAWAESVRCIPEPLAADTGNGLGLFGWVEGTVPEFEQVDAEAVNQVLSFLEALNAGRTNQSAAHLPMASEACLSIDAHIDTVHRRLETLVAQIGTDSLGREAQDLLEDVSKVWRGVKDYVKASAPADSDLREEISPHQRYISPSDLGFHNALISEHGRITFLDFEYAGWDDPAKLICDFFHQEKIPVSRKHYALFRDSVIGSHSDSELEAQRVDCLMPVYGIKWLIMRLNEFRPEGAQRRAFAEPMDHPDERKAKQLEKARKAFSSLVKEFETQRIL